MSNKELKLEKVGLKPRTVGVEETVPEVHGDEEIRKILLTSDRLRGPRGPQGDQGRRGRRGVQGLPGDQGVRGLRGFPGNNGQDGAPGPIGLTGRQGERGPRGETGPRPRHRWNGTKLSFEKPDGTFGPEVNLQGPTGGRGMSGRGSAHNEGFSSISLVGTNLVFARDKAGPLGPDITVDLSGLAGGGFAGLGPWRYRTELTDPPASGQVRFNNADPEAATEVYIHETNSNSEDLANFLNLLEAGDLIYIQDSSDASKFILIEVSTNTDDGTYRTIVPAQVSQQGGAIAQNTSVNLVMSVAGGGVGSVVTGLTTEAVAGQNITLTQTSGGNQVADTSNFLWQLGRAGGQTAIGGTAAGEQLILQGSSHANRGRNVLRGGANVEWNWTTDADVTGLRFNNVVAASGGLVTANIFLQNNIGVNNGLFIMSAVDDNSTLTWSVSPGFAVTTLFFARQNYRSLTPGVAPAQALIYAAQSQFWLTGAGDVTTSNYTAVSFVPIIRVDNNGDDMRITNTTGLRVAPAYNTRNANSTADYGTIRGLHMSNASVILFGQGLGAEIATAWIGLDVEALTGLNVSGRKAAVRSNIGAGANNRFLENLNTAASDFGSSHAYWNDNFGVAFGSVGIAYDAWLRWVSARNVFGMNFFATGDDLDFSSPAANRFLISSNDNAANEINFDFKKFAFGQSGAVGNQVGVFVANARTAGVAGGWADFLLTQAGNLNLGVLGMSDVSAWVINPISFDNTAASISELATLKTLMNSSAPGITVTRRASIWNTGRIYQRGKLAFDSVNRDIAANTNDYSPATLNSDRQVLRLTAGSGAVNITGFAIEPGQTEDTRFIVNADAVNNISLTHQDAASAAANRVISPTGATYVLGPNECAMLWYDATTARWRILWGTGA